ncbi:MAG: MazG family protein [Nocardioides sp.]|uniref:MazG family protein n=1 Tax=Nocardioides sp. TaxID=35761 RepID=UPI0039E520C1
MTTPEHDAEAGLTQQPRRVDIGHQAGAKWGDEDVTRERVLEFLQVMRQLRSECSWKASQSHRSLVRYLLEEAHETAEAIETGSLADLREELGDLLLQVWFHAVIAEQAGEFALDDVLADIIAKMRRRNPHVFSDSSSAAEDGRAAPERPDAAAVNEVWEAIKATEKRRATPTEGLPTSLPALLYADKVLDRLARSGQREAPRPAEQGPVARSSTEIGESLLAVVADARASGVDPEQALRDAVRRLLADTDGRSIPSPLG